MKVLLSAYNLFKASLIQYLFVRAFYNVRLVMYQYNIKEVYSNNIKVYNNGSLRLSHTHKLSIDKYEY